MCTPVWWVGRHGTVEEAHTSKRYMGWAPGARLPQRLLKALVWAHILLVSGISIGERCQLKPHPGVLQ
jgi:hypothetical protein